MFLGDPSVGMMRGARVPLVLVADSNNPASNTVAYTYDLVNWYTTNTASGGLWRSFAYNGSLISLMCSNGNTKGATSPDGITWTDITMPSSSSSWWHVTWNGSVFCAVGILTGTTSGATSPDGITWTSHAIPTTTNNPYLCARNNLFFLQFDQTMYTSPDGITWTLRVTGATGTSYDVAWNGSVYCIVEFNTNKAWTSPDGITWTARTLPSSGLWVTIAWNGSVFCATEISATASKVITSPDGITWTAQGPLPNAATFWNQRLLWTGSKFFLTDSGSTLTVTSPDGITWTSGTMPSLATKSDAASTFKDYGTY